MPMARPKEPHPVIETARLRLRRFSVDDSGAMHRCFADAAAMRYWNHAPHTKPAETERAVRRMIDCTPAYYRFWAVADARTDRCVGMVSYHDGHIRNRRAAIGYVVEIGRAHV